jgi:2',3'-cyclic-nucleotide 2'-phosphodiesterase (5'-nucleotidase family)
MVNSISILINSYECKLLGKDLLQLFEESMSKVGTRHGSFPHFSEGVSISFDLRKEEGSRLIKATFYGEEIEKHRLYSVVSTKYLLEGGDGYLSLKNGKMVKNVSDGTLVRDSVEKYLKNKKSVSPKVEGRINLIH